MQASIKALAVLLMVVSGGAGLSSTAQAQVLTNTQHTVCRGDGNSNCTVTTTNNDGSSSTTSTTTPVDGSAATEATRGRVANPRNVNDLRNMILQRRIMRHFGN